MHISVVCPVFNTDPALLSTAVQSVLSQAGHNEIDFILVDDASFNPATCKALTEIAAADPRIRLARLPANGGPAVARQLGIAHASADLIGFIDADDIWPAGKLAEGDRILADNPDTAWLSGSHLILRAGGAAPAPTSLIDACADERDDSPAPLLYGLPLMRALITAMPPLGASIVRRSLFDAAGGLDPDLRYGEDWLLYLKMAKLSPMRFCREPTYVLRRQRASMMQSEGRMSRLYTASVLQALRDPMLVEIRRELGWYAYSALKDVAMNNALNNRPLKGLCFALAALARDPRELRDFLLYLKSLTLRGADRQECLKNYCTSDQIILNQVPLAT